MDRSLLKKLEQWRKQTHHLPILLHGARQVGKSYLVEAFAKSNFANFVTVNFEFSPELSACFVSLDPQEIINRLSILLHTSIIPGQTLLFLDEIQECKQAILALRYFKERLPSLHVIAAGSLLEFVLNDDSFRMPVGRIQSLYLKPLSFYEYLIAMGYEDWRTLLTTVHLNEPFDMILHSKLLKCVKEYMLLGGMPAVINTYIETRDLQACQEMQAIILDTYRNDFGKYSKKINYQNLQLVFAKIPGLLGQTIKYSNISHDVQSRELKRALEYLVKARITTQIYATKASGLPLQTTQSDRLFKLLYLDVGLAQFTTKLSAELLMAQDLLLLNRGSLAEQFVGQELLALQPAYEEGHLFYWQREKPTSQAEVDFVTTVDSQIIPVEVKAGKTGRLKSMQVFLEEKQLPFGVRISEAALSFEKNILSIPLYMIGEFNRLVHEVSRV